MSRFLLSLLLLFPLWLAGCGSSPPTTTVDGEKRPVSRARTPTRKPQVALKRGGGFYKDDGPGDDIPDGLDDIPDADPKWEPLHKPALKPYVVLGRQYVPNTQVQPHRERGIASWYGKKFHGQKTSIGEPYDMFAMTAAHPTLALPSYVRVTQVDTGQSVVVRVIDRGPFHAGRVIDLSYTAAYKLGVIDGGSGEVEIEAIVPGSPTATRYAQIRPVDAPNAGHAPGEAGRVLAPVTMASPAPVGRTPPEPAPLAQGIYLQLGAFANAENAENLRAHLGRELDWVREPMSIAAGGGFHRLQLGPYASRSEADATAEKIRSALGTRPTVVVR